jgi:beta-lactamase class A
MPISLPPQANVNVNSQVVQNFSVSPDLSVLSSTSASDVIRMAALRYQLDQVVKQNEAQFIITSVKVADLQTGDTLYKHDPRTAQYAASLNKIPIALLLLQDLRAGTVHLTDTINWTASDVRGGFGFYDQPGAPTSATVQQLVQDMLNRSGNTAVRILVNQTSLGGAAAVNARLAQDPKLVQTRLQLVSNTGFYLGNTTVSEGLRLMEQLQKTKDSYEQVMQNALATNVFTDYGVRSQLAGNSFIQLANKVGILDDTDAGSNRHDEGIVYNSQTHRSYGYSFMTTNFSPDLSANAPAEQSLEEMGLVVLRFAGDTPTTPMAGPLQTPKSAQTPQFTESPTTDKKVLY